MRRVGAPPHGLASGAAVDTGTVFEAASLTKPSVACAVLQLAEHGLPSLDEGFSGSNG